MSPEEAQRLPKASGRVVRPASMSRAGRTVWDRLAPDLVAKGALDRWCVDEFEQYCEAVALARAARRNLDVNGILVTGQKGETVKNPAFQVWRDSVGVMTQLGTKFCLKPVDRRAMAEVPPNFQQGPDEFFTSG